MINNYLTDEITIIRRSFDSNGVPTNSTTSGIKARVEDFNKILININGVEMTGNLLIITDDSEDINYEDFIKISKKNGITYENNNKEFPVLKIENVAGFMGSHKEIYI